MTGPGRGQRDRRELARPELILLWDLDGTIADTRHDIARGVAGMLEHFGLRPLPVESVVRHVGRGVRVLVDRSLSEAGRPGAGDLEIDEAVQVFRTHYRRHMVDTTIPFGNIAEVLGTLRDLGRRMAIVSNKPEEATRALVTALGLADCFRIVLGGDSLTTRKPSPEPLLHALEVCRPGARPSEAALIGDSIIDLQAGRAAGMPVCGVGWGMDPDGELRAAGADWWFETVEELTAALLSPRTAKPGAGPGELS